MDAILKLRDTFTAAVKRLVAYRRQQEDLAALCEMTQRELRDIGLNRYDVGDIAS